MEYEGWNRRFVKVLKDWGFEPGENKATSHRKWLYKGPKTERPITIIVPVKVKTSSRAVTISSAKKKLREAGASKESLVAFNNYSLGLLEAEAGDTVDVLEDKLAAAVTNEATLIAARLAFALAKAAADTNYVSSALEKRSNEIEEEKRLANLTNQIQAQLLRRIQGMFNRQIERSGPITIGDRYEYHHRKIEIDDDIVNEFGFFIDYSSNPSTDGINLSGHLRGETLKHFQSDVEKIGFVVTLKCYTEEEYYECWNGDQLCRLHVYWLYQQGEQKLEEILAATSSRQVLLELRSRLGPSEWEE